MSRADSSFDIRRRDGLSRTGTWTCDENVIRFPVAVDMTGIFPALRSDSLSNIPLSAGEKFTRTYWPQAHESGSITMIHPFHAEANAGDLVMVSGWHTVLKNPRNYVRWLTDLKERVPPDTLWYAPASAIPSNAHILCYSGFDLFDFIACDLSASKGLFLLPEGEFSEDMLESGVCGCAGCQTGDLRLHNRSALQRELSLIAGFITRSQMRELTESRCRMHAEHVGIMRLLDSAYSYMEQAVPIVRGVAFGAMTGETLNRVEIRRYARRVVDRYVPPEADTAVLLPCSARKPYSLSQSHRKFTSAIQGRAHELIVTSPVGLVPRELELVYPAAHYDVPVTGYWDREEKAFISQVIGDYLLRHRYRRIIAHLDGGALDVARIGAEIAGIEPEYTATGKRAADPASLDSLNAALSGERRVKTDLVKGISSWQFGVVPDTTGIIFRGRYPDLRFAKNQVQLFSLDTLTGLLRPTFEGWKLLDMVYRVYIEDFLPQGDILAPGILDADPQIREGDEVLITGAQVTGTGRAAMPANEMIRSHRGVAVRVRRIKKV